MLPYDFAQIRSCSDLEAACHAVFEEVYKKWTTEGHGAINESQLTVICVETFFGEVCNGGLEQYFLNQSGRNTGFGPQALRRVGLSKYAPILEDALKLCTNVPREDEFGDLEDFFEPPDMDDGDPLDNLDKRFFELYHADRKEFRTKLFQFIVDHEADFVSSP